MGCCVFHQIVFIPIIYLSNSASSTEGCKTNSNKHNVLFLLSCFFFVLKDILLQEFGGKDICLEFYTVKIGNWYTGQKGRKGHFLSHVWLRNKQNTLKTTSFSQFDWLGFNHLTFTILILLCSWYILIYIILHQGLLLKASEHNFMQETNNRT